MLRRRLPPHVLGILTLATAQNIAASELPYNPTRIFHANASSYAYVIQPDTDSNGQAQLISVDVTSTLEASSFSKTTLYSTLPFLEQDSNAALLSVADNGGNITLVSGDCSSQAPPQIWTFTPDPKAKKGNGTWTQQTLSSQDALGGVRFLGGGMAYSEIANGNSSDTNLYTYGGMCPTEGATAATWTTAANYTHQTVEFTVEQASSGNTSYAAKAIAGRGPPVAEAGFSLTPLVPSYSADTTDATQQQSFVLIGGHTNGAFINMSQVAMFSLPQQSWTFLGIDSVGSASSKAKKRLSARSSSNSVVEPRSGHTAVLSEDGDSIVMFGGWVGDVTTPAKPQLAILELGSGFGGDGDWAWNVPTSGSANLTGSGLYGHGAVMLPGGVMMLSGGFSIPSPSATSRMFRRATTATNTQTLFYNVTSSTWLSSYDPPAAATSSYSSLGSNEKSKSLSTPGQKAGLGVGLVVGVVLIVGLVAYYFWRARRQKKKRENRLSDKEGLVRRSDTFGNNWYAGSDTGIDGRGGSVAAGGMWGEKPSTAAEGYASLPQNYSEQPVPESRRDVERSGVLVNVPSPTRGLRKNGPTRAQYQYHAAPRYEDGRVSRSSGNIHPIEERDEEEDRTSATGGMKPLTLVERNFGPAAGAHGGDKRQDDPFKDPPPNPLRSHPVSPEIGPPVGSTVRRSITNATNATNISNITTGTDQVSNWIREWTASYAAAMRPTSDNPASNSSGRVSPTKTDERTSSNLSEQSNRSGISAGATSVARTSSTRSAMFFGLSGRPSITPSHTPIESTFPNNISGPSRSGSPIRNEFRSHSGHHLVAERPYAQRSTTADSYSTAATTWGQLMEQGEALLGTASPTHNTRKYDTAIAPLNYPKRRNGQKPGQLPHEQSDSYLLANAGPTPPIPPRRRLGWMGSLRRALGTYDRSFSSAAPLNPHHGDSKSMPPPMQEYYDHIASIRSNSTSPNRGQRAGAHSRAGASSSMSNGPRRTASDSSEFLRLKRGRRDWEADAGDGEDPRWAPYRDEPDLGDWGEGMVPDIVLQRYYDVDKPLPPITGPNGVGKRGHGRNRSGTVLSSRRPVDSAMDVDLRRDAGSRQEPRKAGPDGDEDGEGDWDVEGAIAKRDVQVMFTLPKARLRVVNADPESASQRSVSGGSAAAVNVVTAINDPTAVTAAQQQQLLRVKSETDSLESFRTAQAQVGASSHDSNGGDSARESAETVRKTSNYGVEITEWERQALEQRDDEENQRVPPPTTTATTISRKPIPRRAVANNNDDDDVQVVDMRRSRR
ncbi:hypothetical protein AAFC00_004495 [Neodothiora populina]|uniref:Galactose oxidase n=1 Tax=Neodothiora populina TaxID=2781224 RepID=A0ABR3P2Q3_9PEZI